MTDQCFKDSLTPATIDKMKFRIPLYQRPYAWEEKQVQQLLNDLYNHYNHFKNGGGYYIGILSVAKTQDDHNRFDLIDGQQRITTLILIGKAALEYHANWKNFVSNKRLELYGRSADQAFLDSEGAWVDTHQKIKEPTESTYKMQKAIETAKNYLKDIEKNEDRKQFSQFIYENAAFFISEVPSNYTILDKNQQFVRMNNRGRQLENHEILKVQLTSKIDKSERKEPLKFWNKMLAHLTGMGDNTENSKTLEEILTPGYAPNAIQQSSNSKEHFYMPLITVPEFLLIALARYLKKRNEFNPKQFTFDTDKLLETFGDDWNSQSVIKFAEVIKRQMEILMSYFVYISRDGNKVQYKFQSKDGKKSEEDIYSSKFIDDEGKWKRHLKTVQSFLHVSTEPHHWLVPAFDWCEEHEYSKPLNAKDFVERLEKIDNELIRSSRNLTPIETLEDMKYENISHYWFYRLDYELWKSYHNHKKNNKDLWSNLSNENMSVKGLFKNFCFRRCSSIEHINPQKPMEKDPIDEVHSFGNLALISGSRNSRFYSFPPDGKKSLILDSEYTESLKMAHFLWCGNGDVKKSGEMMHEILYNAVFPNGE